MEIIANGKRRNRIQLRQIFLKREKEIRELYQTERQIKRIVSSWLRMQIRLLAARFEVYGNDKNH